MERSVGDRLELREGDITALDADAIVNAANEGLRPGGGVCGAIHRAAGPSLALECARVAPCPTGDARITRGGKLKARFVIHAVGPVWEGGTAGEADLLASCYRRSLTLAREHGLHPIAFPAISTGLYRYPVPAGLRIGLSTILDFLREHPCPQRVTLCTFSLDTTEAAREALRELGAK